MFALRTVPNEATGLRLAELVYGRLLRSPLQMLREAWERQGKDVTVVAYVLGVLDRRPNTRKITETNMSIAQRRATRYYDRTVRRRTFHVGDKVMLLRPTRQNRLEVQWEGPADVLKSSRKQTTQ